MKALTALTAIALVFFLAGCSDKVDSPVSTQQNAAALSKIHEVPFNTTYEAVAHITPTGPSSGHAVQEGSGNATHVGRYTSLSTNDITYTSATAGVITNGTHTTYAASGDKMYATYSGTFAIANGVATFSIDFIFDGGTGRFENLHGEVQVTVTTDDVGQLVQDLSGSGSGHIVY